MSVIAPSPTIVCIDCGGICNLLTLPPEEGDWRPGDVVAYRCQDCNDRWDIVLTDDDVPDAEQDTSHW